MYNITLFPSEKVNATAFGYSAIYSYDKIKNKIAKVKNLQEAAAHKNKKMLILLENHEFDEGAIKIIAEKKKVCFLIDFSRIINSYGLRRAIIISKLRTFLKLCNKYGAFYTFADFANDDYELRRTRELIHISLLLGLNLGQAKFALKMLIHYIG